MELCPCKTFTLSDWEANLCSACGLPLTADAPNPDPYVAEVISKHKLRAAQGYREHGDRWDQFDTLRFLDEAQQEAMDLVVYLERAIWRIRKWGEEGGS